MLRIISLTPKSTYKINPPPYFITSYFLFLKTESIYKVKLIYIKYKLAYAFEIHFQN